MDIYTGNTDQAPDYVAGIFPDAKTLLLDVFTSNMSYIVGFLLLILAVRLGGTALDSYKARKSSQGTQLTLFS